MRNRLHISLVVLAVALAAAGCGSTGVSGDPVASTEVTMVKSYRFEPDVIKVTAGDTVTWTNDDNFTHTVRVDGQDDHKVDRGESFSLEFDKPGKYHYVCTLHSHDMEGEVIVQ